MNRTVHVLPSDRGWAVTVEDTDGATSHYPSQEEAVAAGREKASKDQVELVIHGPDGQVQQRTRHDRGDGHGHDGDAGDGSGDGGGGDGGGGDGGGGDGGD
ncbi:DUF2188 domain-containing protein [Cupriavidus gilardii]|jgi:hypothetical protein|uniref:DUF2188 domain-containing protein n=1 Tax=Cupriavidus gilardii TaxID=82541 RepID=UPI00158009C9|nr:DUF2188 domain-containing protein [Cupriavidus gilardii]MCT9072578.1 DUF2188 domain-containing protein [Cupriavidus gilardii]QKS63846.1 DUF2188 domain-containing protein [Cupriavidus gilardii]